MSPILAWPSTPWLLRNFGDCPRQNTGRTTLIASDAVGVGHRRTQVAKPSPLFRLAPLRLLFPLIVGVGIRKLRGDLPAERRATAFVLLASGVGNNPDAVSSVRGTNGARRNTMPFRISPDLGQVSEYSAQPSTKQRCHVLQDREAWSYQANGSNDVPVESRTGSGKSGAGPGIANVLTGESGRDNIRFAFIELPRFNVIVARHVGPVLRQHVACERINLAERHRLESARALQAKAEAANAAEEVKDTKGHLRSSVHDFGVRFCWRHAASAASYERAESSRLAAHSPA